MGQVELASYLQRPSQEFVSPGPGPNMLSTVDVDEQGNEDETGDVQVIVLRDLFAKRRRELGGQVVRYYERDGDGSERRPIGRDHSAKLDEIENLVLRFKLEV